MILDPKKRKSVIASTFWPSICHEVMELNTMILVCFFLILSFKPAFSLSVDSDCSHEIRRCLLLGRKTMTNLDSILKSTDVYIEQSFGLWERERVG